MRSLEIATSPSKYKAEQVNISLKSVRQDIGKPTASKTAEKDRRTQEVTTYWSRKYPRNQSRVGNLNYD